MPVDVSSVRSTVSRLASLPPGPEPFVTLYLDMRSGSTGSHPGLTYLRGALARLERAFGVRGAALDSFRADSARIQSYLDTEFDPAHQGVAVFACHARGVFEAIPLALGPENQFTVAQSPKLYQMTRFLDDYTTYCVALLSRTGARVFTVALGDITTESTLHQSERHTSKNQGGGLSMGNYQRHVEHNIADFAEEVAKVVAEICARQEIARVVLGGEVVALGALERALPAALGKRAVSLEHMDAELPDHKVLLATLPVMAHAQAEQEVATVNDLLGLAAGGELAVTGVEPTLYALQAGAADKLVMADSFAATGWRCTACTSYGSGGMPTLCPACQQPVVEVDLKESLAGNAVRLSIPIEYVRAGSALDAEESVGAFLRYRLP